MYVSCSTYACYNVYVQTCARYNVYVHVQPMHAIKYIEGYRNYNHTNNNNGAVLQRRLKT